MSTAGIFTVAYGFPNFTIMGSSGNNVYASSPLSLPEGQNPTPIGIDLGVTAPTCNPSGAALYCAGSALPAGYSSGQISSPESAR